jgi:hypothetical protein
MELEEGRNGQEHAVEAFLAAAKHMMDCGKAEQAERIYKQAMRLAEAEAGDNSALVGVVLVDYMRYLESQGRKPEAEALWERIRGVMVECLKSRPEIMSGQESTPKVAWDARLSDGEGNEGEDEEKGAINSSPEMLL